MVVFCYDVVASQNRRQLAKLLEERLLRVQRSVFEGRLTPTRAYRLFDAACTLLEAGDSLRLYVMTREGLTKSRAFGGVPMPQEGSYILL